MQTEQKHNWLEKAIIPTLPAITYEIAVFAVIILLAVATRFYDLGARVMSHDESLHTYFSWLLYKGQGYVHSPMMHGPLQFHLLALTFFLFGVSDFTARIPAALFSVAAIGMVWYWRRYLGKSGALVAGALLLISPYMLYYGRYVRNEAYAGFFGILMLYAMLRHLETGANKYLYLVTAAVALHFTAKETAFIYSAQALLFLAIHFIAQVTRRPWSGREKFYWGFILSLAVGILLIGTALGLGLYTRHAETLTNVETAAPANPSAVGSPLGPGAVGAAMPSPATITAILGFLALAAAGFFLIAGCTWKRMRAERSFSLFILIGTLVLPMLTPFALKWLNWTIPTTAPEFTALASTDIFRLGAFLLPAFLIAAGVGLLWNKDVWWKAALLFYGIFTLLYTTVFTNGSGFFTGLIGSLGYWLVQQGVERGSQPWYYYLLVQIPIYEFLPALGATLALFLGLRRRKPAAEAEGGSQNDAGTVELSPLEANFTNTFPLLAWWSISSLLAFSYAGEKMPWLTYHIAWPMILLSGWALGDLIERTDWAGLRQRHALLVIALTAVFLAGLTASLLALAGTTPPFQGKELTQLQATANFTLAALTTLGCAAGLIYLLRDWRYSQAFHTITLTFFFILAVLTGRAAFRAAYINYDNANEYLVYAHSASGVKEVMAQAEEISRRTAGDLNMSLAYDASAPDTGVSWPFVWYLRDYTDLRSFDTPTRALRDAAIIIVDQKNFAKIEPVVGQGYYRIDYIRMWWPNQDYFGLTKGRVLNALKDARIRAGIVNIWFNRDYRLYAEATGSQALTLTTWEPSDRMRLYIRKDIAAQIWNYGVGAATTEATVTDPYEARTIRLAADLVVGSSGQADGQFNAPRGIAFARDGSFYVADSRNQRIQRFAADGAFIGSWGIFADNALSPAPLGTFNEPWGVAVAPDGSVYVTDTWNHRVQKFSAGGRPIITWGHYGLAEQAEAFWGPRGIAVDAQGRVYVADTGNKRIAIFDANGNFLTQFGSAGLEAGQFDEPVGVAVDAQGIVYVTDAWNQRLQTFMPDSDGLTYLPYKQWDIFGWYGQSLDNKPFIAVDDQGHVFVTDPEGYRVLEFDAQGEFVRAWGDYGLESENFGLAAGIAVDRQGRIWVTDAGNNRAMRFTLPNAAGEAPPAPLPSPSASAPP